MRAYIKIEGKKFDSFRPSLSTHPDFLGYIPASEFTEYHEVLNRLEVLEKEESTDPDLYIPLTAGLVIRDSRRIAVKTEISSVMTSLFSVEVLDFEGGEYLDPVTTILSGVMHEAENSFSLNREDFLTVVRNPLYFMGVFLRYENARLTEIRMVYTLMLRDGIIHLMNKDRLLKTMTLESLSGARLNEFSNAIADYLPIIR